MFVLRYLESGIIWAVLGTPSDSKFKIQISLLYVGPSILRADQYLIQDTCILPMFPSENSPHSHFTFIQCSSCTWKTVAR